MKSTILLLFTIYIISICPIYGQGHQTVNLELGSKILDAKNVNTTLVLLTGKEYIFNSKLDWKIKGYDSHLTLKYDVPVPKPNIKSLYNSFIVISPGGNNVYYIRRGMGGLLGSRNTQSILHIDSTGFTTSMLVKGQLEFDHVNVVFADDDYLYYVTKEKDRTANSRHAFPKLQFVRVGKDKSVSKIWLSLPDPDPDATEWPYFGDTKVVSYFVSRTLDDENYKTQKYRVAVIDHDGKLVDDFKIGINLKNGKFMPGYNYNTNLGSYEANNHNIDITYRSSTFYNGGGSTTTMTTVIYTPYPEAFGNIMLDPISNGFYVYGISGNYSSSKTKSSSRSNSSDNSTPSGYYVYKFDQDGKDIRNNEGKLNGVNEYFKTKAGFAYRSIVLRYGSEGNLKFHAFAGRNATTYDINSQTGKFISGFSNAFENGTTSIDLGTCHKSGDKSDMSKFLSKPAKGDYSQLNFRMLNNNIVVQNYFHDSRLEMYDFEDE